MMVLEPQVPNILSKYFKITASSDGFTLIELLMVVMLIGILSVIGIPQFLNFATDAKIAVTRERMVAIKVAIVGDARLVAGGKYSKQGYEYHCLGLPTVLTDLITQPGAGTCAALYDPFTKQGWRGPYVSSTDSNWNYDAWGNVIKYSAGGRTLTSFAQDQTNGTSDDIIISF